MEIGLDFLSQIQIHERLVARNLLFFIQNISHIEVTVPDILIIKAVLYSVFIVCCKAPLEI